MPAKRKADDISNTKILPITCVISNKLSHEDYTVGWICPLEVEQIAALEMLDEEHERLPQSPTDHNVYNLGSIAGHNVVIAGLHQPGNTPAATVVTQMRMTFPSLRFGILVGIGGGVPVKTDNGMIRLGDIVVSKPVGVHSGAIQYDHGKAKVGKFERTGALAPPPAVLLNAAQDLAAKRARSRKDPIEDNIKKIDTSIRGLRRYKHPSGAQDHLYKPDYIHREPGLACDDCGCDSSQRIQRPPNDDDEEQYIVVHRGTIASGELVVKDAKLRDELAKEHGLLCFEMEAAGALADFPCIVVRGISDYCDSHKNDQWHGYAAAAAAAYARQLFFHMPIDEVKRYISETAEKSIHSVKVRQDNQDDQKILDWLTLVDYGSQQTDHLRKRQLGTGQWFLDSPEFQKWLNTDKQTLFCPGMPGAGKTVLTSIVVEELTANYHNNKIIGIAYLYCDYRRQHEQKAEDLLLSLLKQLAQNQSPLPESVKTLYDKHEKKRTMPLLDEISKALQSVTSTYSKIFFIIDALDEYQVSDSHRDSHRKQLLSTIFDLQSKFVANIFVTSRIKDEIARDFTSALTLKIRANDDDIQKYVNSRAKILHSDILDSSLQKLIVSAMIKVIDGMFLLAELHMNTLLRLPTKGHIMQVLQNLNKGIQGLDPTYEEAMKRIDDYGKQILAWIFYAKRPLSITELQHALAVQSNMSELDPEFLPSTHILRSRCAGLMAIDEESDIVRLVHYTTQEFFERTQKIWFPNDETKITETCVTYLSFDVFKSGYCQTKSEFLERLRSNKLYDYAAHNWGYHAREASTSCQGVVEFLQKQAQVAASSEVLLTVGWYSLDMVYNKRFPKNMTGLHLAAYFGLEAVVEQLLATEKIDVNSKDDCGCTPLRWAVQNGYKSAVQQLLAIEKVNVNLKDNCGRTPLWWAVHNRHKSIIQQLLAMEKVDVNSKDDYGRAPLLLAAKNGYKGVVQQLLAMEKIDINSKDNFGATSLWWAAQNGHEGVIQQLLTIKKVDVDSKDLYGQTPLWWATRLGHEGVVQQLLATKKVNVNSKDNCSQTPLWWAVHNGHGSVVQQLLAIEEIDVNSKDDCGRTPLWWAAQSGYESIVQQLLATKKVDINSKDNFGATPLWWAIQNGHEGVIQQFFAIGQINTILNIKTPLFLVSNNGFMNNVN